MAKDNDKIATGIGCVALTLWGLFSVAWIAFVVWAIYTVVTWLVTK